MPSPTQTGGGKGGLIFDYSAREYSEKFPEVIGDSNIFVSSPDGSGLSPITNMKGYNLLKDISPDGTKALFVSVSNWDSTTADLYSVEIAPNSQPIKLAEGVPYSYNFFESARWLDGAKIVYVGQGDKGLGIYIINVDGTNLINIETGHSPVEIVGVNKNRVFWKTNQKSQYATSPLWWSNIDGSETQKLNYGGKQITSYNLHENDIAISPNGTKLAWVDAGTPDSGHTENWLQIANIDDIDHPIISAELITSGADLKWRQDGKSLIVFDEGSVNWGFGKGSNNYGFFEVSAESGVVVKNYQLADEIMGAGNDYTPLQCGEISPDDKFLPCIVFTSDKNKTADNLLPAQLNFLNLETGIMTETSGFNFFFSGWSRAITWIP
jgi:Tol biopolymer transport system component